MFYAHFVLSKKGPLARIWLAAHWDKKLTKAHVFETNIDSSVEAILKPKVKMALRTSGHLMLGVVRIYSRKAKYLLADCNEAFVKIKMAFRPGVVDLPEENREAAVAAITLQENFHDFETTLADLEDIDVQAQFSVNQSRPEEITMREDLGSITLMGDDGFGDVGFDEREILRDTTHLEDPLYKSSDMQGESSMDDHEKTLTDDSSHNQKMDVDLEPPVVGDGFGDGVGDAFMGQWGEPGGLFEDTPMPEVPLPQDVAEGSSAVDKPEEPDKVAPETGAADAEETVPLQAAASSSAVSGGEQTTLVHNEDEAFALEPLDVTAVPGGTEKKGKRKRKLIVDEQKGIPSETMKLQLSDTTDIVTTLDLAPPTKKLMHWKETGGVEKLFLLPGRPIVSRATARLFGKNLITKHVKDDLDLEEEEEQLPAWADISAPPQPEIVREEERTADITRQSEMSTIAEEPSNAADISANTTRASRRSERSMGDQSFAPKSPSRSVQPEPMAQPEPEPLPEPLPAPQDTFAQDTFAQIPDGIVDNLADPTAIEPTIGPNLDLDNPPSVAPFSVPPPSNAPPSVGPNMAPAFEDLEDLEAMPENEEQDEKRLTKRTQQMQSTLRSAFTFSQDLSFKDMTRNHNRKQAASRFYTLLVLKKHQVVEVDQSEAFGDIIISEGPHFGRDC
ncbi:hypothetical protein V1264_009746 [Littorina saxatilis]|uniref:Double-strand-break repair protein rad21-like protein n=1 Tax=Littorina saxatilis TaxID=31220 RepID=A0AAN9G325_9CAEN